MSEPDPGIFGEAVAQNSARASGRLLIAQRFQRWVKWDYVVSAVGTAEFSHKIVRPPERFAKT